MILSDLIVPTIVATPGTTVKEVFQECCKKEIPGIPFQDASGRIVGKVSMRYILKETCIPDYLVTHAVLLGDQTESLNITLERAREVLALPVDRFILPERAVIAPGVSIAKALAVMERHDTTYLFVMDGDTYLGCVSIMGIGETMMRSVGGNTE